MSAPDVRAIDAHSLPKEAFGAARQEFRVCIAEEAFDRATARGGQDLTREVGGVLVGRLGRDDAGPFVVVETTIDALHAEEKGTELTFTHATWDHIHAEMDAKHKGRKIVGWYHTHPGFGIFLSDRDTFIHHSFFSLPFQIALVYDPKSREHGLFAWRDGEPVRWRQYWIGDREHQWDGSRVAPVSASRAAVAAPVPEGTKMPTNDTREPDEFRWDRTTVGLGALALLVIGGLVGTYLGRSGAAREGVVAEPDRAKLRSEGATELSRQLNLQLVSLLRQAMTDAPVRQGLDRALASLDDGLKSVPETGAAPKEALDKLRQGRDVLARLREMHEVALLNLRALEDEGSRLQGTDVRAIVSALSGQAAILGRVCAEMGAAAQRAGDDAGAQGWLALAVKADPQNAESHGRTVRGTPAGGGK